METAPPGRRVATDTQPAPVRSPPAATIPTRVRHVAVVTDAWHPQINGVVQTWTRMDAELRAHGLRVTLVTPDGAPSLPVPGEPELRLVTRPGPHVQRALDAAMADPREPLQALHIATEGPLGWAARAWARRRERPFTTSYHTRYPEYLAARFGVPAAWTRAVVRRFHARSQAVLAATPQMVTTLSAQGFERVRLWPRGVDAGLFAPGARDALDGLGLTRPIWLSIGRVAREKNLEAFLALDLPGSMVIVGDGPARTALQRRHPRVHWLGARAHATLPPLYRAADVFVFPSRTDTFGLVMLEAMACGTPVAAFPVTGPVDVVETGRTGVLDEDLRTACLGALSLDRDTVRRAVQDRGWHEVARILGAALVPFDAPGALGSARPELIRYA